MRRQEGRQGQGGRIPPLLILSTPHGLSPPATPSHKHLVADSTLPLPLASPSPLSPSRRPGERKEGGGCEVDRDVHSYRLSGGVKFHASGAVQLNILCCVCPGSYNRNLTFSLARSSTQSPIWWNEFVFLVAISPCGFVQDILATKVHWCFLSSSCSASCSSHGGSSSDGDGAGVLFLVHRPALRLLCWRGGRVSSVSHLQQQRQVYLPLPEPDTLQPGETFMPSRRTHFLPDLTEKYIDCVE